MADCRVAAKKLPLAASIGDENLSVMHHRWLVAFFLFLVGECAAVRYDMTKEELLLELGKPTSVLARPGSGHEVLLYPKGVRIEIDNGKVVSVKGIDLAAAELGKAAAAEAQVQAAEAAKLQAEEDKARAIEAAAAAKAEKEWAAESAKAHAEMEKSVEAMENRTSDPAARHHGPPEFDLVAFLLGLVIKWILMVAALKLTTKYWSVDVDWSGLMIAAAADTGVRGLLSIIGTVVLKAYSLFYLDEALAAIVLVLVLRKVSTNQSLNQAVTIAFTVKVFSIVVGSIVMVGLMGLLH